jgi:cephalosporin-C deacetylase-like acetyl esterase
MNKRLLFFHIPALLILLLMSCENKSGHKSLWTANDTLPVVFDNFEEGNGFEIANIDHKRYIQLSGDTREGILEEFLFDKSALYDVTLNFIDEPGGNSTIDLYINERKAGSFLFELFGNERRKLKQVTIPDVDIQKWSRISLVFHAEGEEKCRVESLTLRPKGEFRGVKEKLKKPSTPEIFVTAAERSEARESFTSWAEANAAMAEQKRLEGLKKLKTPADWQARQKEIRRKLPEFVGEFPEKTPLNPMITGTIDRKDYSIEKVIFESQPGYFVTANFYLPKNRTFPVPGVLFTSGHSADAKANALYHETCLGLVLKGYAVLAFDPIGQGERSEYIDPKTHENTVALNVNQHHYIGKPSMLIGWTLAGIRIWDGIRALDYMETRHEVDKNRLAVAGNSGGGEMTLLITAFDERVKVCAASHPGGSMEETYLGGGQIVNREIFSLIPPRPCRINVGKDSGEEESHRKKIEDMQLFYEGLGFSKDLAELVVVDGVHDMKKPKREATYEWLNKWFDKQDEGKEEAQLEDEKVQTLWCSNEGKVLLQYGGETGQKINAKRADNVYDPDENPGDLKERIAARIGLDLPDDYTAPRVKMVEKINFKGLTAEKFWYESKDGMKIPSVLLKPETSTDDSPVYIYVSEKGKPRSFNDSSAAYALLKNGFIVMAMDVRGTGETSPTPVLRLNKWTGYDILQWKNDVAAINCMSFGKTTLGLRTLDIITGINYIKSRKDLRNRRIIVAGEGLGGLWAMLAAIYDIRVNGVVTEHTLPTYMHLVKKQYYSLQNYFWVPGALHDFDIPDLAALVSPKPQVWIHPVNGLNEEMEFREASSILGSPENLRIITPAGGKQSDLLKMIAEMK